MANLQPYATIDDLAAFWRALTPAEQGRANALLPIASNRLRGAANDLNKDLDELTNDNEVLLSNVKWVVMEAVKRALQTPLDTPPVDTFAQTAGPYSENIKFTNPSGDLWFKKSELSVIGLYGNQSLGSITPVTRKEIYS